jgi:hypothetical protein
MSVRQSNTFVRLGSDYGGWWIPKDVLDDKSKNRLMISVGLGFDVTFDQALLDSGFEVIGLDPLKDSINYANHELRIYPKFTSINMGLWTKTGIEKFTELFLLLTIHFSKAKQFVQKNKNKNKYLIN